MNERRYDMDWLQVLALLPVAAILLAGCWTETKKPAVVPEKRIERTVQTAVLLCRENRGECFGFYSFTIGLLPSPPANPDLVDLVYYFDADDCKQGALVGRDDRPGYLFPVGRKSWDELLQLKPPTNVSESVAAIEPLTKDKGGLAFWVKARGGQFFLARISSLQPTTYSQLRAGRTAMMEIEWTGPVGEWQDIGFRR